jgi:hypothetical protein
MIEEQQEQKRVKLLCGFRISRSFYILAGLVLFFTILTNHPGRASDFRINLPPEINRQWIGPEFWANRLEDWRLNEGKLECLTPAADRYLYLLISEIKPGPGSLSVVLKAAVPELPERPRTRNFIALRLGVKGKTGDYREAAVFGQGMDVGLSTDGLLFIADLESVSSEEKQEILKSAIKRMVEIRLDIESQGNESLVRLTVSDPEARKKLDELEDYHIPSEKIAGGLALVSSLPEVSQSGLNPVSWFVDFQVSGALLDNHKERAFGPLAFCLYTLSKKTLKLNAQFIPRSISEEAQVKFEIQDDNGWQKVAESSIDKESWSTLFRFSNWDYKDDITYRLVADDKNIINHESFYFSGKIRKEPVEKDLLSIAVLSNNQEEGFPHSELVANLKTQEPDLLYFAGNQVYGRPDYLWREKIPLEQARQEYLRQWLLFGWAFGDLLKERPAIINPDFRDFFQTKLWGEGGKLAEQASFSDPIEAQDNGGFLMPAQFIRLVLKTQTSHLPDSEAAELPGIGIKPFFCEINYAGLSMAVLDDRMFRTAPKPLLPEAQIKNGWALNPEFDLKNQSDVKKASLHGQEQLAFLKRWASDWSSGTWMKAVLSQTLWVSLVTLPEGWPGDEAFRRLPLLNPGEYPPDDRPVADFNSGAWPRSSRDEAIKILREAFAVHIAGFSSPACTVKYGVESFDDAGWAFVPSPIVNSYLVRWFPQLPVKTPRKKEPSETDNFEDAFGNKFKVRAVSNPCASEVSTVYRGAPGYGIVRFERKSREIMFENWPRRVDPVPSEFRPYPGWPVAVNQLENNGEKPAAYLPTLKFRGIENPVVQVVDEKAGEIVYTLRISRQEFRPAVYRSGTYTVRCGEPGTSSWKEIKKVNSLPPNVRKIQLIEFSNPGTN